MAALVGAAACVSTQIPVEATAPRPQEVILRATVLGPCPSGDDCESRPVAAKRRGILVFVDADSLVMTDLRAGQRVTLWPNSGVLLEVYRGQHRSLQAAVEGAVLGAAKGAAAGAATGLLMGGLAKMLGSDADLGDGVRGATVLGAGGGALGGANQALAEGKAVWERVTLLQLRQQMCRCADPDGPAIPR
jgi:hypothetical protein